MRIVSQRQIERFVTGGLVYDSRIDFNFRGMGGLAGKFSGMVDEKVIRNSKYVVKAHLAQLDYLSNRSLFRCARFLLRRAPEDYEFLMSDGFKRKMNDGERRKLRRQMVRHDKGIKACVRRNVKMAREGSVYRAFRTGEGLDLGGYFIGILDMADRIQRLRGRFSFD